MRTFIAVAALAAALAACSSNTGTPTATSSAAPAANKVTPKPLDLTGVANLPAAPAAKGPSASCDYQPSGAPPKPVTLPSHTAATDGTATIALTTSQGPIGLTLNKTQAPCTVHSFVSLAKQGYYDNSPCHRLSTENLLILQCGDPTGSGTGGPGYAYANEFPSTAYAASDPKLQLPVVYPRGTIAMANTGQPRSNGSQFFLVYADSPLPPMYTVFGTISEAGLATIEKVAVAGDDGSIPAGGGKPNLSITIEKATAS